MGSGTHAAECASRRAGRMPACAHRHAIDKDGALASMTFEWRLLLPQIFGSELQPSNLKTNLTAASVQNASAKSSSGVAGAAADALDSTMS